MIDKAIKIWEEDGDLERMKLFFNSIGTDTEQKERIRKLTIEKLNQVDHASDNSTKYKENTSIESLTMKEDSWRARINRSLKSIWWRWQWKIAIPIAGILIFIMVGQAGLNNLNLLSMGNSKSKAAYDQVTTNMAAGQAAKPSMDYGVRNELKAPQQAASTSFADSLSVKKEAVKELGIIPPQPQPTTPPADPDLPRKITHHYFYNLQVDKVDVALERLKKEVTEAGGYVVESQMYGDSRNPSGNINLKIPADKYEVVKSIIPELGKVLNHSSKADDITNQYYDAESRLRNWEAQEKRYLDILAKANTVDDILRVESALSNIRMQIEQLKGQLKLWNHEVAYSSISINLSTKPLPVNINDPWKPVSWQNTWQAAKDAFLKTVSSTWNGFNYLIIGIGYALPYLILAGIGWGGFKWWKRKGNQ